ncbi:MAG: hypothetical protein KY458_02105 [Actinobacteria bacterium]|nr:hypothetical protein [Actinomycetota bacterium]
MNTSAPDRVRLGIFVTLAVPQLLIGVWAVMAPRNWFQTFPGVDPRLVAAEPPFNMHLATDAGAGFLATGVALAVAALWGHRVAVHMALVVFAAFAVPHLMYHALRPAPGLTSTDDAMNVFVLASGPALAVLFAWWTRSSAPKSDPLRARSSRGDRSVASFAALSPGTDG